MTERFEISRRKALAALGTIGVASAGAGLGTSALFSDQETFEDNTITAGTLDMTVTATQVANSSSAAGEIYYDNLGLQAINNGGGPQMQLVADDVKPGDWVIYCFEIDVEDNPGFVTVHADNLQEDGGANPEPEQEVEEGDGNSADLGDYLYVSHWGAFAGEVDDLTPAALAANSRGDLSNIDNTTMLGQSAPIASSYGTDAGDATDMGGSLTLGDDTDVVVTDLREFIEVYDTDPTDPPFNNTGEVSNSSGVLIRNDSAPGTPPLEIGGAETGFGPGTFTYYMLIELPFDVGNEVQGDSVTFDLGWSTEQRRNNSDPRSGITFGG